MAGVTLLSFGLSTLIKYHIVSTITYKYTPKYYAKFLTVEDMRSGIWVLIANTDYFFQYPILSCIVSDSPKVGGYECLTFLDVQMLTCEGSGRCGLKLFIGSLHNLTVISYLGSYNKNPVDN